MAKNLSSSGKGPTQRMLRVGELIRRTLSDALARHEIHDPDLNAMSITISEVRVSGDLRIATVFALPLGGHGREEAIAALKRNNYELRRIVAREVLLRNVPELRYIADDTFDRMDETRRLFADETVQRDVSKTEETPDEG